MATKRQRIEEALQGRFEFRYNVLTGSIEYRKKDGAVYLPHTNYVMNSIIREIDRDYNENITEAMYYSIIMSDFTEGYHPVEFYFYEHLKGLGETSSTAAIERLASTVTVANPDAWYLSLKRWLVASVANGLTAKGCQNHTCIVFTGGMGLFKTTWLNLLCPPILAPDAIMAGKINLNLADKDTFMLLATKFIINLDDQLRNLMKKDSETMKTLITQGEVSVRRPFAKFSETLARMANFVASINGQEFMAEDENRRFLPFLVTAIDINAAQGINMNEVWNEAYYLWKSGFKYWWSKDELEEYFPDIKSFAFASDELEQITNFFKVPETKAEGNVLMNAGDIQAFIRNKTGLILSTRKIGQALTTLNAIVVTVRVNSVPIKKYALIEIDKTDTPEKLMEKQEMNLKKPIYK